MLVAGAAALVVVSGGSSADPRTPSALPGLPPPFLGTAVAGSGGLTAAVDAYGDVVDLRAPGPAGAALIYNPAARQAAGTVSRDTGIVPRVRIGDGPALPLWRADSVSQVYVGGTNAVRTTAVFGAATEEPAGGRATSAGLPVANAAEKSARVTVVAASAERRLALVIKVSGLNQGKPAAGVVPGSPSVSVETDGAGCRSAGDGATVGLLCMESAVPLSRSFLAAQPSGVALAHRRGESPFIVAAEAIIARAVAADRAWLARAEPLGDGAPAWARSSYRRSLLALRALTDRRSGAVAAGARDGWAYVWPRDAAAVALAYASAGYGAEARRVAGFLTGLDPAAAARFHGDGSAVTGRAAQGDAAGWIAAAARAAGPRTSPPSEPRHRGEDGGHERRSDRNRADYQEGEAGNYLANAIAAGGPLGPFATAGGLVRVASNPGSGLDSAAAWAVRPFPRPSRYPQVRRTLLRLAASGSRFGIVPGAAWPEADPWTAPTAWSAWALASLSERARRQGHLPEAAADRRAALALVADLRRAATAAGGLPERVDARTGIPRSTTPLAWSHAFAILALRELWP